MGETLATPALQEEIARYVGRGFEVTSQTETSASLVKRKRFSFLAFILLLLLFALPGLLYVAWYAAKKDQTVFLYLEDDGRVRRRGGKWTLGRVISERARGVN